MENQNAGTTFQSTTNAPKLNEHGMPLFDENGKPIRYKKDGVTPCAVRKAFALSDFPEQESVVYEMANGLCNESFASAALGRLPYKVGEATTDTEKREFNRLHKLIAAAFGARRKSEKWSPIESVLLGVLFDKLGGVDFPKWDTATLGLKCAFDGTGNKVKRGRGDDEALRREIAARDAKLEEQAKLLAEQTVIQKNMEKMLADLRQQISASKGEAPQAAAPEAPANNAMDARARLAAMAQRR